MRIRKSSSIPEYIILLIFIAVVLLPAVIPAFLAVWKIISNPELIQSFVPSGRKGSLLLKTTGYAAAVALVTFVAGSFCGLLLFLTKNSFFYKVRWLVILSALIPPYIHALAWSDLINFLNRNLGLGLNFSGWWISILVQSMYFLPLSVIFTMISLKTARQDIIDSARVFQRDEVVLYKIIIPLILPLMLTGAAVIFVFSLTDFTIPSLFGINIYPMEIFMDFSSGSSPGEVFITSAPLLAIPLFLVMISVKPVRDISADTVMSSDVKSIDLKPGIFNKYMMYIMFLLLIVQISVPFFVMILDINMWTGLYKTLQNSAAEIIFSVIVSTSAVILSLPITVAVSGMISKGNLSGRILVFINFALLALPSSLVGVGLINTWNAVLPDVLYSSPLMPVIAIMARFMPLMILIMAVQTAAIDRSFIEEALLNTSDTAVIFLNIRLPLLLPGILAATCLMFILGMGELGATLMVMPPGTSTLTVKIYNYLHYGSSGAVKGLCFLVYAASMIIGYLLLNYSGFVKLKNRGVI